MIKRTSKIAAIFGLSALILYSCVSVKPNVLYIDVFDPNDTVFYSSSEIYSNFLTSEAWFTQSEGCIAGSSTKEAAYKGGLGIDIQWNRTKDGCPWLGFGFGWDNWTGKDLSGIRNTASIQFYVRMVEGERSGLPWAVGLEDFTGAQAWLGVTSNAVKADKIGTEWVRVEMPISEFSWDEQDADISNIKQIIFNTEADGHVYIDEIEIVPYTGGFRKRANIEPVQASQFSVDGQKGDAIWNTEALEFGNNKVHIAHQGNFLCVAAEVKDDTPLLNSYKGKDVYRGDAFEIAFSTDLEAKRKRSIYLTTDQHIGFALTSNEIRSWDWVGERELKYKEFQVRQTADGYIFEARIDLNDLEMEAFEIGKLYGLEVAVDHGDEKDRQKQERWNDAINSQFYVNPSLWGEMYIVPEPQALNNN